MKNLADTISRWAAVFAMGLVLVVPQLSFAQAVEEEPTALAMVGDMFIARPLLLGLTVLGTATYIISLPFSAAGGNAGAAADTLVIGPAEATFVRCLGCTQSGYKKEIKGVEE